MLLLTVTSLAISCFSVKASVFKKQSGSKTALSKSTPKTIKPKKSAEEILKLQKQAVLDASRNQGAIAGTVGICVPAGCAYFSVITFLSVPFVAIGFGTAVACSLLQDMYRTSKDDKKNTTSNERVFAHAKGIGSVGAVTFLGGLAQKHLSNPDS